MTSHESQIERPSYGILKLGVRNFRSLEVIFP